MGIAGNKPLQGTARHRPLQSTARHRPLQGTAQHWTGEKRKSPAQPEQPPRQYEVVVDCICCSTHRLRS